MRITYGSELSARNALEDEADRARIRFDWYRSAHSKHSVIIFTGVGLQIFRAMLQCVG